MRTTPDEPKVPRGTGQRLTSRAGGEPLVAAIAH